MKVNYDTTSNFSKPENFVVFECINRLLEKGYRPEHIEIEKKWALDHDRKGGKGDICKYDIDGKNMLQIIECNTYGAKYKKALEILRTDGSQFYPTDHCGLLRVDETKMNPHFVMSMLDIAGQQAAFNRSNRASIDRIKSLSIPDVPLDIQNKVIVEVEEYQAIIAKAQAKMQQCTEQKKQILNNKLLRYECKPETKYP